MKNQIVSSIYKFRWLIALLGIIFASFCYLEKSNLSFTDDYRMFFAKDNVRVLAYDRIQKIYDKTDNVLIVIQPDTDTVFNEKTLSSLNRMTSEAWRLPFSTRVESLTNYQHSFADEEGLSIKELYDGENISKGEIAKLKSIALSEPQVLHRLVSDNGEVAALNIVFNLPGKAINESAIITSAVRNLVKNYENSEGIKATYLSGSIMLNTAFGEVSQKDANNLTPIMYLVVIVLVGVLLKSIIGIVATLLLVWICTVVTTGMMASIGILMTPPSAIAPTIILTIAVADTVHILSSFLKYMRNGMKKVDAISKALKSNFFAITLTSITTAIGFLTLNFSEAPPYQDLGNVVAIGVITAYLYSVFWLPALLYIVPLRTRETTMIGTKDEFSEIFSSDPIQRFIKKVIEAPKKTLALVSVFAVTAILLIPMNRINDAYVEYFSTDTTFRTDTDFIEKELTGVYSIELDIRSKTQVQVSNPEFLQELDSFANWARDQEVVVHVSSITDVMKKLNMNLNNDNPDYYRLPIDDKFSPQALFLYEMSLPYGLDLNNQLSQDKKATRVVLTLKNVGTEDIIKFEQRVNNWIEENTVTLAAKSGSPTLMFSYISEQNVNSMLVGTFTSLALISLLIGFTFKSLKYTAIAMVTNFIPITVAFGIWGLLVGEIGLSVSIVSGISLGIVVDDTIHLLANYNFGKKYKNLSTHDAILYAYSQTGYPLVITSLVLIAGFAVMAVSSFLLNSSMGLLTAVTLFLAIVFDFTILPALLTIFEGEKSDEKATDTSQPFNMLPNR